MVCLWSLDLSLSFKFCDTEQAADLSRLTIKQGQYSQSWRAMVNTEYKCTQLKEPIVITHDLNVFEWRRVGWLFVPI